MMEDLIGDQPMVELVPRDLEAHLHLACDDGEPRSFTEAERHVAWRAAMQSDRTQLRRTAPGSLLTSLVVTARLPLSGCSS
jgi:hypothetical protein